jgi:hypothetical protein
MAKKRAKPKKKPTRIVRVEGDVSKKFGDAMLREFAKHTLKAQRGK